MVAELEAAMKQALSVLHEAGERRITIFHHNDTDGLAAGAILRRSLKREGFRVRSYCLEKPYPAVLEKVLNSKGKIFIFTDFAGRIAPRLAELNAGRNLVLILDHHAAEESGHPMVFNLDPELYGLRGDRDISASVTCYLFASCLNKENRDLSALAVLGAVGDRFFTAGRLVSENGKAAVEAEAAGLIDIIKRPDGEQYLLTSEGGLPCREQSAYLDVLGAVGYYRGGPELGVRVCLKGRSSRSDRIYRDLSGIKEERFLREAESLARGDLRRSRHIQWFDLEERFSPMGVKMVGIFCDYLKDKPFIREDQYIAGFQRLPEQIPGLGRIRGGEVKVSMRVPDRMKERILNGEAEKLSTLLPLATAELGGFSDACHSLSAATTVKVGQERALIQEMEKIMDRTG